MFSANQFRIAKYDATMCEVEEDGVVVLDATHDDGCKYLRLRLDGIDHATAARAVTEEYLSRTRRG